MNTTLLELSPFLVVLYILFAFVQVLRHKRQGTFAMILGLLVILIPLAAALVRGSTGEHYAIMNTMALGAVILFVSGFIILLIERGNSKRDKKRSYGILGLGMSIVLALAFVGLMLTPTSSSSTRQTTAASTPGAETDGLVNVSQSTGGTGTSQGTGATGSGTSAVAKVLEEQTGLSAAELAAQVKNGSTIAQLVAAHQGDLDAVTTAIATTLERMQTRGGAQAQLLSSLGTDPKEIATKIVEGQLPEQAQQTITERFILGGGQSGQNSSGGFAPPGAGDQTGVPASDSGAPPSGAPAGGDGAPPSGAPGNGSSAPDGSASVPTAAATAQPAQLAVVPTDVEIRPTLIVFPSPTPTPLVAAAQTVTESSSSDGTATESAVDPAVTCSIVVDYNLNLRDKPTSDGSTILLSIPYGTVVTTSGHTVDKWYKVTYQGQTGWVSGTYITLQAGCIQLPTVTG